MSRKPRIHVPGGLYHVTLRGNARGDIFFDDDDRFRWESILEEELNRYGHRLHAYCWMTNHIHAAVQCSREPLSQFMANLSSRYAKSTNRKLKRSGHLFERRYNGILVQADAYLLELVRYIHRNPLRAGMTKDLFKYRWSSHLAYSGRERPAWLTVDWVYRLFASTESSARDEYLEFMRLDPRDSMTDLFRKGGQHDDRVLGNDDFLESVTGSRGEKARPTSLDHIIESVCEKYGVTQQDLDSVSRKRILTRVRAEIGFLAREAGVATITEVARRFGRSQAGLSRAITNFAKGINTSY